MAAVYPPLLRHARRTAEAVDKYAGLAAAAAAAPAPGPAAAADAAAADAAAAAPAPAPGPAVVPGSLGSSV
jgi:hypothetical protein